MTLKKKKYCIFDFKTTFKMEDDKPAVWGDEVRMNVLFSPFRDRDLNPPSWDDKMKFWVDQITNYCRKCGCLIFDLKTLQLRFERAGKLPKCFSEVISEMKRQGKIKQLDHSDVLQFSQSSSANQNWLSWGYQKFVKLPFSWGWKTLAGDEQENIQYLFVEVLQDRCTKLLQSHYCDTYCDIIDSVVEYNDLWDKYGELVQSETDFLLVLKQLVTQKKITVHQENSHRLIRFCLKDEKHVSPVKERDLHIFRIKKTSEMLLAKTERLSKEKDQLRKEAVMYKKKNMVQYALRSLRQSKKLQRQIDKLTGSLDLLDDILNKIRHAVSDEMVVVAIESGTSVLKGLTEKSNLDKVTDIMDNLAQVIEDQEEIDNEISMSSFRLHEASQEDLEDELANLLDESVTDNKEDKSVDDLSNLIAEMAFPKVPNISPSKDSHSMDHLENLSFPEVPKFSPETSGDQKVVKKEMDTPLPS